MQNTVAIKIWDLELDKIFLISAAHVPGRETRANEASRIFN